MVHWLRIRLPMQGMWVPSLVRELRSHMPQGQLSPCTIHMLKQRPSAAKKTQRRKQKPRTFKWPLFLTTRQNCAIPLSFSNFSLHVSGLEVVKSGYPIPALKLSQNNEKRQGREIRNFLQEAAAFPTW